MRLPFKILTGSLLSLLWFISAIVSARDTSPSDRFYAIEFMKPQGAAAELKVHLFAQASPAQVEGFLTGEIRRASAYSGNSIDIMASAEYKSDRLALPDGSTFLVFIAMNGKIVRGNTYFASARPRPTPTNILPVSLDIRFEVNTKGPLRVIGKTNLPDKMIGTVELRNAAISYDSRDTVVVSNGAFTSTWFSARYRTLPPGTYQISFTTPLAVFQPPCVQLVIGKNGENLSGPCVTDRLADNIVKYDMGFDLK